MQSTVALVMLGCALLGTAEASGRREVQYEYFDDYLLSVTAPRQNEVLKDESEQGSEANSTTTPAPTVAGLQPGEAVSYEDILGYFRDVPREHWSCCMLGMLAGNKGFHCHVGFYAARVSSRNTNRAHTRRLPFHGRDRVPQWGRPIMHTFSRCVRSHAEDFHTCCYAATVERRERVRWQQYREVTPTEQ